MLTLRNSFFSIFIISILGTLFFYRSQTLNQKAPLSHLGGDFKVQSKEGTLSLATFKGRPLILYFGFTKCPDVCPLALYELNRALDRLGVKKRKKVSVLFISLDWKRDSPELATKYAYHFSKEFVGAYASQQELELLSKKYAFHFEYSKIKDSQLKETIDHTSRFYLVSPRGKLLDSYAQLEGNSEFISDLEEFL